MKYLFRIVALWLLISPQIAYCQELIVIESKDLKCNDSVLVFSPQNTIKNVATVFLLHGWSGCYKDWSNKCDLQQISNKSGFRIICPDGFYNSWYLNNSDKNKMQWRDFFDNSLFPAMQKKYSLVPDSTFITGLSMGGHGAINLFIDNPSNFCSAGSMSGVLNLQQTKLKDSQISSIIEDKKERLDLESAINRIDRIKNIKEPIIITCGYDDIYAVCSQDFSNKCKEENIPHVLVLSKGTHSWKYWAYALEMHLNFFNKILRKDNLGF